MLNESIISFNPEEKQSISKWIKGLKRVTNKALKNGPIDYFDLELVLNKYSDRSNPIVNGITVEFYFYYNVPFSARYHSNGLIQINLLKCCSISSERLITNIDFSKLISSLVHELVHWKQDLIKTSKSGTAGLPHIKDRKLYYKDPYEQRAIAIQYLEYLKQQMDIENPDEIISNLRKMGMLHRDTLTKLKTDDPKSWKAIMKHAIAQAQSELKTTLPWQNRKLP